MITQEFLQEHFDYNEDGYLILKKYWNDHVSHRHIGERMVAKYEKGKTRADRYERIVIEGIYYLVHHLIWFWHYGYMPEFEEKLIMDHEDMNKLNNRIKNLRWVTYAENSRFRKYVY